MYFSGDDASPGHWIEQETDERHSTWNVTYSSKNKYEEREYEMTVRVYYDGFFGRDKITEGSIRYKVTNKLNGHLEYFQNGTTVGNILKSTNETEFNVIFHDPSNFLQNAKIQYFWFVNDTNYGPTEDNKFLFKFSAPGWYTIETIVMAQVSGDPNRGPVGGDLLKDQNVTSLTSQQLQDVVHPPHMKTGVFRTTIGMCTVTQI